MHPPGRQSTESERCRLWSQVVLHAGENQLVLVFRIAPDHQSDTRCADDADRSAAPVEGFAAGHLVEMPDDEDGDLQPLCECRQRRQGSADVLIAEGAGMTAQMGDEGIDDE